MKRNRRNQSAAVRFVPAMKAAVLVLLLGGSAVGYVWQKNQIGELGRQMKDLENRLDKVRDENGKLNQNLAMLRSPLDLERRVKELNLGLGMPSQAQFLRISETPERVLLATNGMESSTSHVTLK